ncbi:MAG TPA: hypothetical protein VGC55_16035 [Dokdonella sp.]
MQIALDAPTCSFAIPARAGIPLDRAKVEVRMQPGLRRDDGVEEGLIES